MCERASGGLEGCETKDPWGFVMFWCLVGLGVEHLWGRMCSWI